MKGRQQEASYAARAIREFLDGSGRDRDWDNFTSCSLLDPTLDSIRRRALAVDLPVDAEGEATLRALQAEAEDALRDGSRRPLANIAVATQPPSMLRRVILSPWFPFCAAALFAVLSLVFKGERTWLLGLAGTAAFWGGIDLIGVAFGGRGEHQEARFDTTNKRGPNGS